MAIVIGAAEKPFVNSGPPFATGPIVKFSDIVVPLVRTILFSPIEGPPPPTDAQPGAPDTSCRQICASSSVELKIKVPNAGVPRPLTAV